jgi:hypothetical protein
MSTDFVRTSKTPVLYDINNRLMMNHKLKSYDAYFGQSSGLLSSKNSELNTRMDYLKEKIGQFKRQTELNNELNIKARNKLVEMTGQVENFPDNRTKKSDLSVKKSLADFNEIASQLLSSKSKRTLRSYVNYRQNYMHHASYWQQIWLFTDNPIYEYGT